MNITPNEISHEHKRILEIGEKPNKRRKKPTASPSTTIFHASVSPSSSSILKPIVELEYKSIEQLPKRARRPHTPADPFSFSELRKELHTLIGKNECCKITVTPTEKKDRKRTIQCSSERNVKGHFALTIPASSDPVLADLLRFQENPKDQSIIQSSNWLQLYKVAKESGYVELHNACQEFAERNLHLRHITKEMTQSLEFHTFLKTASEAFFDKIVEDVLNNFTESKGRASFERISPYVRRLDFAHSKLLSADALTYFSTVCPYVKELDISKTAITSIPDAFKELKIVNISFTAISQKALEELAIANPNIRELYARNTQIHSIPTPFIQLKILDLTRTQLTQEALHTFLKRYRGLERLSVERNPQIKAPDTLWLT